MRAAARRRGRCAAPRCRYNRLSLAKVGCGAMEGAKSLDQGPGSEEVWAPADVWAQAGLAREALEALPVAVALAVRRDGAVERSEEHTSELQSLMRISSAVFCLKKKIPTR